MTNTTTFDLVSLYAYLDASHLEMRSAWRGFLSYTLSQILESDIETSDELVTSSITTDPSLVLHHSLPISTQGIQQISSELAQIIGLSYEFGLASLLDSNPPTKTFPLNSRRKPVSEQQIITIWLTRLITLQQDPMFQTLSEQWREMIDLENEDDENTCENDEADVA